MTDCHQLLAVYVQTGSDAAFRELVSRYINLVYSTALRLVNGDAHRAQDVTQTVFIDLARKASTLSAEVMLGGWLHRHTCYVAANFLRSERRRQVRERLAVEMQHLEHSSDDFSRVAPLLDEAINELGEEDRTAIVLRFFEQHDLRAVGKALGSSEDAARMRIGRALDKLQALLKRRGFATTSGALASVLSTHAVQAAPAGLAVTITATAAIGGAALAPSSAAITKAITVTALQKTLVATLLVAAIGTGLYQAREASRLRKELSALQSQQSSLVDQLAELQRERDAAANRLAALADELERGKGNSSELLKLRGEVSRLRTAARELDDLKAGTAAADPVVAEAAAWKQRVSLLKEHLQQNPAAGIPELELLSEQDWLNAARAPLRSEKDYRKAMSKLRFAGENAFANKLNAAVDAFKKSNDARSLSDISQLQPYFDPPVDSAMLQRYAVLPASAIPSLGMGGSWIISTRVPIDAEFDGRIGIGPNGWGSTGSHSWGRDPYAPLQETLQPIMQAYMAANGGREPKDPADLLPYLKTPEQQEAFRRAMELKEGK